MSSFSIAMLYISALMGAGFASGKEIYNFFGRYGNDGIYGIILVTIMFISFPIVIMYNADKLKSSISEEIICPIRNSWVKVIIKYLLKASLFISFTAMLSAGGSVFKEQLHISGILGGAVLALIIGGTVVFDVNAILFIFRKIVPAMLISAVGIGIIILLKVPPNTVDLLMAPPKIGWLISSVLYLSYNLVAAIPILGTIGNNSYDWLKKKKGGVIGGIGIGLCTSVFFLVGQNNLAISENFDLPMIYYAGQISSVVHTIYAVILVAAVYCSASNCLYGVQSGGKDSNRVKRICLTGIVGYIFSLIGFGNIVKYVYPMQGLVGLLILVLLIANSIRLKLETVRTQDSMNS